jgi:hypothetical protein
MLNQSADVSPVLITSLASLHHLKYCGLLMSASQLYLWSGIYALASASFKKKQIQVTLEYSKSLQIVNREKKIYFCIIVSKIEFFPLRGSKLIHLLSVPSVVLDLGNTDMDRLDQALPSWSLELIFMPGKTNSKQDCYGS